VTLQTERDRLFLQIERELAKGASLRALLEIVDGTVASYRRELRAVQVRIKRRSNA